MMQEWDIPGLSVQSCKPQSFGGQTSWIVEAHGYGIMNGRGDAVTDKVRSMLHLKRAWATLPIWDGCPADPDGHRVRLNAVWVNSWILHLGPLIHQSAPVTAIVPGLLAENASLSLDWTTKVKYILPEFIPFDGVAIQQTTIIDLHGELANFGLLMQGLMWGGSRSSHR